VWTEFYPKGKSEFYPKGKSTGKETTFIPSPMLAVGGHLLSRPQQRPREILPY